MYNTYRIIKYQHKDNTDQWRQKSKIYNIYVYNRTSAVNTTRCAARTRAWTQKLTNCPYKALCDGRYRKYWVNDSVRGDSNACIRTYRVGICLESRSCVEKWPWESSRRYPCGLGRICSRARGYVRTLRWGRRRWICCMAKRRIFPGCHLWDGKCLCGNGLNRLPLSHRILLGIWRRTARIWLSLKVTHWGWSFPNVLWKTWC